MPGRHESARKKWVRINPNRPKARRASPRREPLAYAGLVPIVVTVAAWLGFDLDGETAAAIIGAVVTVWAIARPFVTPVADPVVTPSEDVAVNPPDDPAAGVRLLLDKKGL